MRERFSSELLRQQPLQEKNEFFFALQLVKKPNQQPSTCDTLVCHLVLQHIRGLKTKQDQHSTAVGSEVYICYMRFSFTLFLQGSPGERGARGLPGIPGAPGPQVSDDHLSNFYQTGERFPFIFFVSMHFLK